MVGVRARRRRSVREDGAARQRRRSRTSPSSDVTVCVRGADVRPLHRLARAARRAASGANAANWTLTAAGRGAAPPGRARARRRHQRAARPPRARLIAATRGRCRSCRASCGPRRGSGRATCRGPPRASGSGSSRPGRPSACRAGRRRRSIQRWPWTWKVWKSEPIAITSHCTRSPTRRVEHRRVADERAPVDRHELAERREDDLELAVGRALVAPEDREHPEHAAVDRVHHRRRVVVVGPHARRSRSPAVRR